MFLIYMKEKIGKYFRVVDIRYPLFVVRLIRAASFLGCQRITKHSQWFDFFNWSDPSCKLSRRQTFFGFDCLWKFDQVDYMMYVKFYILLAAPSTFGVWWVKLKVRIESGYTRKKSNLISFSFFLFEVIRRQIDTGTDRRTDSCNFIHTIRTGK